MSDKTRNDAPAARSLPLKAVGWVVLWAGLLDVLGWALPNAYLKALLLCLVTAALAVTIWHNAVAASRIERQGQAAEESNRRVNTFLSTVLDAVPCMIYIRDASERFVFANKAVADIYGVPPESLIGKTDASFARMPEEVQPFWDADRKVLAEHIVLHVPNGRVTDATGELRYLQTVKMPIRDLDDGEWCVLGVSMDITERVVGEQKLAHSNHEIRDLYELSPCGYHSLDENACLIQVNQTELDWLGYTRDEVIGKMLWTDFIVPEEHERFWKNFLAFQASKDFGVKDVEITLRRRDGSTFPVVLKSTAVRDEEGRYLHNRTTLFDLSERKEAEQRILLAKEEAERANGAKSEFLSRMSHELRTPLNSILGFAQLMELEGHEGRVGASVQHILRAGRHLLAMINEILELSRIETGHLSVSLEPVEIASVIREASTMVGPLAEARSIELSIDGTLRPGTFVVADRQRLLQVCLNLLSNAIKYNVPEGQVAVSADTTDDGTHRISVTDTGLGIDEVHVDQLFAPFARLGADTQGIEGTGLGLALSKGLVQYMGGTLTYRRGRGSGSVFTVELKAAADQLLEQALEIQRAPQEPVNWAAAKSILLIDDNSSNIELVRRVLSSRVDAGLLVAMSAGLGIELLLEHRPDLVLLDVNLPDGSGMDVLRVIKGSPATVEIPVIVTSADATNAQIRAYKEAGALEYLTKPLDIVRLIELIDSLVGEVRHAA